MESWSYRVRAFWEQHGRECKRYGLCALVVLAGLRREVPAAILLGLSLALLLWAYDQWGIKWAERGRRVMEEKRLQKENS
jgi:hypothetical protein